MFSTDTSSAAYKKARRQHLKSTRNGDKAIDLDLTPFRAAEKRYKARFPPPDLSQVLDLATLDDARSEEVAHSGWCGKADAVEYREIGLTGTARTGQKVYAIPRIPGLVLLPSFVSPSDQKNLVHWSLSDQARSPNETNLDTHYILPEEGLWNKYIKSLEHPSDDVLIQSRVSTMSDPGLPEPSGPRTLIANIPASTENFQSLSAAPKPPPIPSPTLQPCPSSNLIHKLRWANIGWSYHWGSKQYDFTKGKGTIDAEIKNVCKRAVGLVDWGAIFNGSCKENMDWGEDDWQTWPETYEPDAGIVNFYQTKDTLMAHVDRSEVCATSPLVSISLGNAAIFLIGGLTRDIEPVPILLRSGDVVIMSGPACRRAYHGVPRILENSLPHHFEANKADVLWGEAHAEYMRTTRININVRQVFPKGFDPSN